MNKNQWPHWSRNLPTYDASNTATLGLFAIADIGAVQLKSSDGELIRDLYAFCDGERHQFTILMNKPHTRTLRANHTWSLWTTVTDQSPSVVKYSNIIFGEL